MADNRLPEQGAAVRDRCLAVVSAVQVEHKGQALI